MTSRTTELSLEHRAWIVENLLAGVTPRALAKQLEAKMPRPRALREIKEIASSPLLAVCARLGRHAARLELVAALGRSHSRQTPRTIERRRDLPPADVFFREYWGPNRPVAFSRVTARWPALHKWTPGFFREHFGDVRIEITAGRTADPDYDANYRAHRTRVRMDRFIDTILAAGITNDLYMVSNNHTMKRPRFRALLADVTPPADLFYPPAPAATSLWIGPAGTITPLHHDTTNILFTQIHGRKRIELVSPQETALLLDARGFYSPVDLDRLATAAHPAVRELHVRSIVLSPGDALFIPAGWWHRVTSLDVSISFSLLGFRRPNDFDWYKPGHV